MRGGSRFFQKNCSSNTVPLACGGRFYSILRQQVGKSDKGFQELQIKIQALVLYLLTSSTSFPIWAPSRVQRYRKPVSCAYIHRLFLAPAIVTIVRRQTRAGSHPSRRRKKDKAGDRTRSPIESILPGLGRVSGKRGKQTTNPRLGYEDCIHSRHGMETGHRLRSATEKSLVNYCQI